MKNRAILLILDGWGHTKPSPTNAVSCANTPNLDKLEKEYPTTLIQPSGIEVGLSHGIMGNSEVGHLNLGAGRVVYQLNTLIDESIKNGSFYKNRTFLRNIDHCKRYGSNIHVFGLLSDGIVHSNPEHFYAFLDLCKDANFNRIYYHVFTDGRDALPKSGKGFVKDLIKRMGKFGNCKLASISGRYYAMDRDNRWERVKKAYDCIVFQKGKIYDDPIKAIEDSYENGITDEFIKPCLITNQGKLSPKISDNDVVFFYNFRADRAREITRSFILPDFSEFEVKKFNNLHFICMSPYDIMFQEYIRIAFKLDELKNILGKVLADNKRSQLRIAETEKYAHVTFFFSGTIEEPFEGEKRVLIPSPKVASYDLKPEMSAPIVKDKILETLEKGEFDCIIANFANCDMVGHTGVFEAAKKAVETVDKCVGEITKKAKEKGYDCLITADHGNAEKMADENGNVFTAHTTNKVKFIVVSSKVKSLNDGGKLADVAPTILELLEIKKPQEMTGNSLIKR